MHITIYSDVLLLQKQIHRFSQKKKKKEKNGLKQFIL